MGFSISDTLARGGDAKPYLCHLDPDGFELGVGRAGRYDAHAHHGFTDIAFAPGGLVIHQDAGSVAGTLHITSPGSWFGPIEFLSDFWFVKFFQSEQDVCDVPDKVTDRKAAPFEGCVVVDDFRGSFNLWHPGRGARQFALRLADSTLEVAGLEASGSLMVVAA